MPKGLYPRKPRAPRPDPPALIAAVREAYLSGQTQDEVAAALGIGRKLVQGIMIRNGIPRRARIKRDQRGTKNAYWGGKAGEVGYSAAHYRVIRERGQPQRCEDCGTTSAKKYEWASLTKNYADPQDYRRLCSSCHKRFDRVVQNLGAFAVRKESPAS